MKKLLFLALFPFLCAWATPIEHFSQSMINEQATEALAALDDWSTEMPEACGEINLCRAFVLLGEGQTHKAVDLFYTSLPTITSLPYKSSIIKAFEAAILCSKKGFTPSLQSNQEGAAIVRCSRGWKIKAVWGAVMIGAGAVVAPFNPPVGAAMITSGAAMVFDGAMGAIDDDDARKNSMRHSQKPKKTKLYLPWDGLTTYTRYEQPICI